MSENHWKTLKMIGEIFMVVGSIALGIEKLLHQTRSSDDEKK